MYLRNLRGKSVLLAGVVVALGVVGVQWALAENPPPPRFFEFEVMNSMPAGSAPVTNIVVKLMAAERVPSSVPNSWRQSYHTTSPLKEYSFTISELVPGELQVVSFSTLRCVAEIHVTAECPNSSHPLSAPLMIQAQQGNFDTSDSVTEWAGFTKVFDSTTTRPFELTFYVHGTTGQLGAKLDGLSRWGGNRVQTPAVSGANFVPFK